MSVTVHRVRVALAEDDHDLRRALAAVLQQDGYLVDAFASGVLLVEHLASAILDEGAERPDVIITDVRMPGFNGLSVAEGLRANGWTLPLIIMSAFADDAMKARVQRLGGAALFEKPFEPDQLERTVMELLPDADRVVDPRTS